MGIDDDAWVPSVDRMWKMSVMGAAALLSACMDMCGNTMVRRVDAPGGRHSAVLFQRDCGATTGFSTQISIVAPGHEPDGAGNVFIADTDKGAAAPGHWGGSWAETEWLSPDHLLIRYAARSQIFLQVREMAGVRISYREVNS